MSAIILIVLLSAQETAPESEPTTAVRATIVQGFRPTSPATATSGWSSRERRRW